jgi:hypothetical protein
MDEFLLWCGSGFRDPKFLLPPGQGRRERERERERERWKGWEEDFT